MSFLQCSKQPLPLPLVLGKMPFMVIILTFALSVMSLPADMETGRRKVVHVLGMVYSYGLHLSALLI